MTYGAPYLHSWRKRLFDLVATTAVFLPAAMVFAATALVVWIVDGRPVLFVQRRIGRDAVAFKLLKIRTLLSATKTPDGASLVPPPTRTGGFLRRCRLDELPQLLCVLTGRMSLVGPRPELESIVATYGPVHRKRLVAKPGLTGLWQIHGDRTLAIHEQMKYDAYYIRKASLWLDVRILLGTVSYLVREALAGRPT